MTPTKAALAFFTMVIFLPGLSFAELEAFKLSDKNIAEAPRGGVSAIAGIDDWWLSNGKVCAAVSGMGHDAGVVTGGGLLVDLFHCEKRNDQWVNTNLLTGMSKDAAPRTSEIFLLEQADSKSIVAVAQKNGVRQEVHYRLREGSEELEIDVKLMRLEDGDKVGLSAMLLLHPSASLKPFVVSSQYPEYSMGFEIPDVDLNSVVSLATNMSPADWTVFAGATIDNSISYGWQFIAATKESVDGGKVELTRFQINGDDYTVHGWFSDELWFKGFSHPEKPGLLQLVQSQLMDIGVGETITASYRLLLREGASVSEITDEIYAGATISGSVGSEDISVMLRSESGKALSQTFSDSAGRFEMKTPEQSNSVTATNYILEANSPWGESVTVRIDANELQSDSINPVDLIFKERSLLVLPRNKAMRLSFYHADTLEPAQVKFDPRWFGKGGKRYLASTDSHNVALSGLPSDPKGVLLKAGEYRVLATKGIEFSVTEAAINVAAGRSSLLLIDKPKRQVDPGNWVSADLHVHSSYSFDSTLTPEEQYRRFIAEGTQILGLTDHNNIGRPIVSPDPSRLQILLGVEMTGQARSEQAPTAVGHSNAFPINYDSNLFRGGAPKVEELTLRDVMSRVKASSPKALLQMNHPRSVDPGDSDTAFFNHLSIGQSYDPDQPLTAETNRSLLIKNASGLRDIDFDLFELLNGSEFIAYEDVKRDWFSFMAQGFRSVLTANSDTHSYKTAAGLPKNYIQMDSNSLPVDENALLQALSAGKVFGTSGPLVSAQLDGVQLGGRFNGEKGVLRLSVTSADWIGADQYKVYFNGTVVSEGGFPVASTGMPALEIPLTFTEAGYLFVEVSGAAGEQYQMLYPQLKPLAFTNPIYISP